MIYETKERKELDKERRQQVHQFFNELIAICKRYDVSISHEDTHGSFIIQPYNKDNIKWITRAYYNVPKIRITPVVSFINNEWHQMDKSEPMTVCGLEPRLHRLVRYNSTEITCKKCQEIMEKNETK